MLSLAAHRGDAVRVNLSDERGFDQVLPKLRLKLAKPRAAGRFYTVLILPHARSRFRKLHLSRAFVSSCALVLGATLLAGLYSPHLLFRVKTQEAALEQMAHENQRLRKEKDRFERSLAEIAGQLDEVESRSGRIASALGVDDLPSSRPAAGGPVAPGTWGPRHSLLDAYRILFRQWELVFAIGAANRQRGCAPAAPREVWQQWRAYLRQSASYPAAD